MALPPLEYPLQPQPRVAVLGADIRPDSATICLRNWTRDQLIEARPAALAGSWQELATAGHLLESDLLELADLSYPLIVFSNPATGVLSDQQRDLLWAWFRLPIFEQLRDAGGALLAWECEARAGFHIRSGADLSALNSTPTDEPCECGLLTDRILPVLIADRSRAAGR